VSGGGVTRSVILSGGGLYRDPWHPFTLTSLRLSGILSAAGHQVEIEEDVADRVADLSDVDLIVVNAAAGPPQDAGAALAGLQVALSRGIGVLAVHVGVTTLLGLPDWESVTGAAWVPGQTMHPPTGPCQVRTYPGRHVIIEGNASAPGRPGPTVSEFGLTDERYSFLRLAPDLIPLAAHELDGTWHPLVWARELGPSRVVADALGHDARSYDSPEHRDLLASAARWLTAPPAVAARQIVTLSDGN
jgi:type 1 glutamine amidotransferase